MSLALAAMVTADEHPVRDHWVDDQARRAQSAVQLVPVDAEHYRGVWTTPAGNRVHVFAHATELIALEQVAGYVPPRCAECDCRCFPQDGPGVHAARCPAGWARYGRCPTCEVPEGARCDRPGTHPHPGRPLVGRPWVMRRTEIPRAPMR